MAVLASETASAAAGREGKATSPDGKINLNLSPSGSRNPGTNPEQLFAAGYSACFGGAIGAAARLAKIALNASDIKVTATVNLNKDESGFFLDVTLNAEARRQRGLEDDRTAGIEHAQRQSSIMQLDSAVESVLSRVESHRSLIGVGRLEPESWLRRYERC